MRTPKPWPLPTAPNTTADLVRSGVTKAMITSRVHRGELIRLRPGTYLAASAWPSDAVQQLLLRARAEVVALPAGVLSHGSAAAVWELPCPGFDGWSDELPSITFPAGYGHRSRQRQAVHHVAVLPAGHVTKDPAGWPVTTVARTAVDLAAKLPLPEALVILDGAARRLCASYVGNPRRRDYTNPRLVAAARQEIAETARACRISRLGEVIDVLDPSRESAAESLSAGHFYCAQLPTPRYQAEIRTAYGSFFPDCLWAEQKLIGECDGAVKYADPSGYTREKSREQILRDLGFAIVRWQAKEIMLTPAVVVERVARALSS